MENEQRIFKYTFEVADVVSVRLPKGAQIIAIATQKEMPAMWAIVNPNADTEERIFHVHTTGEVLPIIQSNSSREYIGTFFLQGGNFVGHLFEYLYPF